MTNENQKAPDLGQQCNLISMSGGKDSTAMALHAIERGVTDIEYAFADTGHEHAKTYAYLDYLEHKLDITITRLKADFSAEIAHKRTVVETKWRRDGVPEGRIARALELLVPTGIPFLDLCLWKGRFPSTRRRFCSEELKHKPLTELSEQLLSRFVELKSWQGVRRDESLQRADLLESEDHPGIPGLVWYRPILDWKAEDCFAIAARHGLKPNPLYQDGMGRVGCMPCIHATKDETFQIALRFPEELARLAEWERIVGDAAKRGVSTFFDARVTNRHLGLPKITAENVQYISAETHGVAAYVRWAKTRHGGKVPDKEKHELIASDQPPGCKSIYGLCE